MKTIKVVAALIRKDNLIFAAQRGYGEFKDKWEFPGGKIEPNETKEQALVREIKEELNASITIDSFIKTVEYDYPAFHLVMDAYFCHLNNPHIELLEAENSKWIEIGETANLDWLPPDLELLNFIK